MAIRSFVRFASPHLRPRRTRVHASRRTLHHTLVPCALWLCAASVLAQPAPPAQTITVTGRTAAQSASITGFGDLPLSSAPLSASVITTRQLQDAGIASLADITRLDASIADAYNPPGYWSQLAVRGYTLDNRFNYRRDGLPVNAETVIGQANKQALEILKGTSGLQAGTSAPGGLVNLVVKRPQPGVRSASLAWEQPGTLAAAVDVGDRSAGAGTFGWRINASAERLDPPMRNARGSRGLAAAAVDLQPAPGSLLEAEVEFSRQRQPSTPGFSLLGSRLPDAKSIDPRTNLNNQAWSLPVVFNGSTASVRYTQALTEGVDVVAHALRQRLRTDDRIAFPFGCSSENNYDRYCSDGSFDVYDFRSEGERRTSTALDVSVLGRAQWAGLAHRFNVGVLATRYEARYGRQAFNYVGSGTIDGRSSVPPDPTLTDENTDRDERSTELHLQDAVTLTDATRLWAGLRHSRLQRDSVRTDGSRPTAYAQGFTTPWLALSQRLGTGGTAYVSWGQGVESEVAPNRARYTNAGIALPALKSRQFEAGYKQADATMNWSVAAFDIARPEWRDIGSCDVDASCTRSADGRSRHTGVESEAEWRTGPLSVRGSAMALRARRAGSQEAALNGRRPTNVPQVSVKLQTAYNLVDVPGVALLAFVTHEGRRMVLPDNSVSAPAWTRLDLGARYTQRLVGRDTLVWRAGVDNVTNQRAWKEAPFQYGHAYLYPMAPRTLHASLTLGF